MLSSRQLLPLHDPENHDDRCDVDWFVQTMCGGIAPRSTDDVWGLVRNLPLYDCVTILAGIHETALQLFQCGDESECAPRRGGRRRRRRARPLEASRP